MENCIAKESQLFMQSECSMEKIFFAELIKNSGQKFQDSHEYTGDCNNEAQFAASRLHV